jgi:hypothetical protein
MRFQQNLAGRWAEHCTIRSTCAVAVEKGDGSGRVAVRPPMGGCAAPGNRARVVPQSSGARGGGDSNNQVGTASRGKVASTVRSWGALHSSVGAREWR